MVADAQRPGGIARGVERHRLGQPELLQHLRDVAHARREARSLAAERILAQQVPGLAQRRAAARRVGDHEVAAAGLERLHVGAGEGARLVPEPGVGVERAAARLGLRHRDLAARQHQQAHGVVIQPREHRLHHAAREERGAGLRHARGMEHQRVGPRLHRSAGRERVGHALQRALAAGQERRRHLPALEGEARQQPPRE